MPNFYFYFISSLPVLHLGAKPPFSLERFLARAGEFIPEGDFSVLSRLPSSENYTEVTGPRLLKEWVSFDTALRNELVKIRAGRKHVEPVLYLRPDDYVSGSLSQTAAMVYRQASIMEQERMFDEVRWRYLDELCAGHFFDLQHLIVYAYKLMILERWEKIASADREALLEESLSNN